MAPLAPAVRKYRESYVVDFAQQSYNSIAQRAPPAAHVSRFHLVLSSRNANLDRVSMSRYLSSARKANHARGDPPPVLCETIFCGSSYSAYEGSRTFACIASNVVLANARNRNIIHVSWKDREQFVCFSVASVSGCNPSSEMYERFLELSLEGHMSFVLRRLFLLFLNIARKAIQFPYPLRLSPPLHSVSLYI